jgi:hypothetical protein
MALLVQRLRSKSKLSHGERAGLGLRLAFGGTIGRDGFGQRAIDPQNRQRAFIDEEIGSAGHVPQELHGGRGSDVDRPARPPRPPPKLIVSTSTPALAKNCPSSFNPSANVRLPCLTATSKGSVLAVQVVADFQDELCVLGKWRRHQLGDFWQIVIDVALWKCVGRVLLQQFGGHIATPCLRSDSINRARANAAGSGTSYIRTTLRLVGWNFSGYANASIALLGESLSPAFRIPLRFARRTRP